MENKMQKKQEDQLTKMAERYCIVGLLEKHKQGLTFKQLKAELKIKEERLKIRLAELREKGYINFYGNLYRCSLRED
jgi:Mn-dependent DtxR family transcriptional regulator